MKRWLFLLILLVTAGSSSAIKAQQPHTPISGGFPAQRQAQQEQPNDTPTTASPHVAAVRYEEDHSSVRLNGSWQRLGDSRASANAYAQTSALGDSVTFTFTGDSLILYRRVDPAGGQADIIVDGVNRGSLSFYFVEQRWQVPAILDRLGNTTHTLTLTLSSYTPPGSSGRAMYIDAFATPSEYGPSAAQQAAFERVNWYRELVGIPPVQMSSALNVAAQAHADYVVMNHSTTAHEEFQGVPGYVGRWPSNRAPYFGYPSSYVGEDMHSIGDPIKSVDGWMDTVYHRNLILDYVSTDMGYGMKADSTFHTDVLDMGTVAWPFPSQRVVYTYPANQQTNVPTSWWGGEWPDPIPGKPTPVGFPISLYLTQTGFGLAGSSTSAEHPEPIPQTEISNSWQVSVAELRDAQGRVVPTYFLDQNTDPPRYLGPDKIFLIPHGPLNSAARYTVHMAGTDSRGVAFDHTWSFTTELSISGVATSSQEIGWWPDRLIDENLRSPWSSRGHVEHLASAEWAALLVNGKTRVDTLRIIPRGNSTDPGMSLGFPKDFVIQYATNDGQRTCNPNDARFATAENWRPLITRFGYLQPRDEPIDFTFQSVEVECVRILGTELSQDDYGNRYMQLNELELLAGTTPVGASGVATSSQLQGWPQEHLIDENLRSPWSSRGHVEHLASAEWVAVLLNGPTSVDRLLVTPRGNSADPGMSLGFPKDFVIQYATNDGQRTCNPNDARFATAENWRPLVALFGFQQPRNEPVDFRFQSAEVECVRILGTELSQDDYGNRYMQLNELELFAGDTPIGASGVATSSQLPSWPQERLIDRNVTSTWSSNGHADHLIAAEWAAVLLNGRAPLYRLRITPRGNSADPGMSLGFPKDFVIQYATNDGQRTCNPNDARFATAENWRPLVARFGFPQPQDEPVDFIFETVQAECVRIMGTELSQDDYGNRYMQLSELELFGGEP